MTILQSLEIQPLLRWLLLALICGAGWLWYRRRYASAGLLFIATHCGALLFWLVQLHAPIGLDRDPAVQEFWAGMAVAHESSNPRAGYVFGTPQEVTALAWLSAAGLPTRSLQSLFAFAPLAIVLALFLVGLRVTGSKARRWLSAALSSTTAPLWVLIVDVPTQSLTNPAAALLASVIIVVLLLATAAWSWGRRPSSLALVTGIGLIGGALLGAGAPAGISPLRDWLLLSSVPIGALFLVPLMRTAASSLRTPRVPRPMVEALLLVSVGGASSWFWWEPSRTVPGFDEARSLTRSLDAPLDFVRRSAPKGATIASSPAYGVLISAGTGRPALLPLNPDDPSLTQPYRRKRLLASLLDGEPDLSLAQSFGVTHLFLGPGETGPGPKLREVFRDANDFRIYELSSR